jgi:hypothetical protein
LAISPVLSVHRVPAHPGQNRADQEKFRAGEDDSGMPAMRRADMTGFT